MKTTNPNIAKWRSQHHRALETLRAESCESSGLELWRKLVQLERLAHNCAEAYCNGDLIQVRWPLFGVREYDFRNDAEAWEKVGSVVRDCVRNIFGHIPHGLIVNGDCRGYALKLDPDAVKIPEGMHTDWGRNGILAAEING